MPYVFAIFIQKLQFSPLLCNWSLENVITSRTL